MVLPRTSDAGDSARAGPGVAAADARDGGDAPSAQQAEAAFRGMLERHARAIARLCRHYEAGEEARRDLEQEILLALWRAQHAFRGDCSERTWVYRIAHNVAATHVTRAMRARTDGRGGPERGDEPARPDDTVELRDRLARLSERVRRLDLVGQQLVLLALEGCTTTEIAEVTGLSATNVTTRLSRLRRELLRDRDDREVET
jgi:RNA polymerase sigma-70 factor, ECF subfamily